MAPSGRKPKDTGETRRAAAGAGGYSSAVQVPRLEPALLSAVFQPDRDGPLHQVVAPAFPLRLLASDPGARTRRPPLPTAALVPAGVRAKIINRVLALHTSSLGRRESQSLLRVSRALHAGHVLSDAVGERVVRSQRDAARPQAIRVTQLHLECVVTKKKETELARMLASGLRVLAWFPRAADSLDLFVDHAVDNLASLGRVEHFQYAGRALLCLPLTKSRAVLGAWTELRVADAWRLDFFTPPYEAVPPSEWRFPTKL